LAKRSEVDACHENGTTPLHKAARSDSPDVVNQLVKHANFVSSRTKFSVTNSHRWIIEIEACSDGNTPLHWAVSSNILSGVQFLIEAGANINAKNDRGQTPLFLAKMRFEDYFDNSESHKDAWPIAKLLLSRGANIDTCDSEGLTPLLSATKNGDWEMVQLLLGENADASITDQSGQSAIHFVFESCRFFSTEWHEDGARAVLKLLRLHGVDFNARDELGNTPLFSAVQSCLDNVTEMLDLLLEVCIGV
jgi:ankyrin repeat protein